MGEKIESNNTVIDTAAQLSLCGETGAAIFSPCRIYRYQLWRKWAPGGRLLAFCCLNCSTADAAKNDPTVARCVKRAKMWNFDEFIMVNLFAYRSTDPRGLLTAVDPVGPGNNDHILAVAKRADCFVCAWGSASPLIPDRAKEIVGLLTAADVKLHYLRMTKDGTQPCHPLYLPFSEGPKEMLL